MRSIKALCAAFVAVAALLVVAGGGVSAAPSDNVSVIVRANGMLDITGDNGDNIIDICQVDVNDFEVIINENTAEPVEAFGVTRDIRVNTRGGNDDVYVGDEGICDVDRALLPGSLRATLGAGDDSLRMFGVTLRNLNILGGSRDEIVVIENSRITGLANINTSSGASEVDIDNSTFGRFLYRGGSSVDDISVEDSDLGVSPRFYTNSGNDHVVVEQTSAKGRVTGATGNGDDLFVWSVEAECDISLCGLADGPSRLGRHTLNVIMGGGDDTTVADVALMPGDRLNGGPRADDTLRFYSPGRATINGYEFFDTLVDDPPPPPPTPTTSDTTGSSITAP